ncbi:hypothetical protein [Bizionia sp.]|uniref:hypothetical protein n=1 Tax=Bizionia sp. TaxID=1954480 RepID=UPI003A91F9D5
MNKFKAIFSIVLTLAIVDSSAMSNYSAKQRKEIDQRAIAFMKENNWHGFPYDKYQITLNWQKPDEKNIQKLGRFKLYHDRGFKKVALEFVKWQKNDSIDKYKDMLNCSSKDPKLEQSDYYINFLGKYRKSICISRSVGEGEKLPLGSETIFYDKNRELFNFLLYTGSTILVDKLNDDYATIKIKEHTYYLKISELDILHINIPTNNIIKMMYGDELFSAENELYKLRETLLLNDRFTFDEYLESGQKLLEYKGGFVGSSFKARNKFLDSIFVKNKIVEKQSIAMLLYITYYSAYEFRPFFIKGRFNMKDVDNYFLNMARLKKQSYIDASYLARYPDWKPFSDYEIDSGMIGYRFYNDEDYLRNKHLRMTFKKTGKNNTYKITIEND